MKIKFFAALIGGIAAIAAGLSIKTEKATPFPRMMKKRKLTHLVIFGLMLAGLTSCSPYYYSSNYGYGARYYRQQPYVPYVYNVQQYRYCAPVQNRWQNAYYNGYGGNNIVNYLFPNSPNFKAGYHY